MSGERCCFMWTVGPTSTLPVGWPVSSVPDTPGNRTSRSCRSTLGSSTGPFRYYLSEQIPTFSIIIIFVYIHKNLKISFQDIAPGEEFLVWYGQTSIYHLGLPMIAQNRIEGLHNKVSGIFIISIYIWWTHLITWYNGHTRLFNFFSFIFLCSGERQNNSLGSIQYKRSRGKT